MKSSMETRINKIAVIVPVFNRRETTLEFLRQIHEVDSDSVELKIIVVDDGSTDGTTAAIKQNYDDVTVLCGNGNLWWTGAVNMGIRYALESPQKFDSVLIINDDLKLDKKFLINIIKIANKNNNALVSSVTINQDTGDREEVLTAGFVREGRWLGIKGLRAGEPYSDKWSDVVECDLLTGASLLVPTAVFNEVGLMDDEGFPHNWGDFEFTLRASLNGFKCLVATKSKVFTEFNRRYSIMYYYFSSRTEYCKNLFENRKYFYGISAIKKSSFMHKSFTRGITLYIRRILGLFRQIVLKVFLPKKLLKKYVIRVIKRNGGPDYVLNMIISS